MGNNPQISGSTLSGLQFQSHGSEAAVMSSEHCENFVIENIMKLTPYIHNLQNHPKHMMHYPPHAPQQKKPAEGRYSTQQKYKHKTTA